MRSVPSTSARARRKAPRSARHAVALGLETGRVRGEPTVCRPVAIAPSARQVGELRVALQERELDRVGRAVAVLGEDHLGQALLVGLLRVVVLVAVDEHDQVGVLLDRAGLAQVGEDRPLVVPLLDGAGEL